MAQRDERTDGATASSVLLARTRAVAKRTGRDLRDLLGLLHELDRSSESVYVGAADEIEDEIVEELAELLRFLREQHPRQELEISIFVAPEAGQGGASDGDAAEGNKGPG